MEIARVPCSSSHLDKKDPSSRWRRSGQARPTPEPPTGNPTRRRSISFVVETLFVAKASESFYGCGKPSLANHGGAARIEIGDVKAKCFCDAPTTVLREEYEIGCEALGENSRSLRRVRPQTAEQEA
jgi:hypothetical protein